YTYPGCAFGSSAPSANGVTELSLGWSEAKPQGSSRSNSPFRRNQRIAKGVNLRIDIGRIGNRSADLLAQNRRILLSEPVDKRLHRRYTNPHPFGDFFVRRRPAFLSKPDEHLQFCKGCSSTLSDVLLVQMLHDVMEQCHRPARLVYLFGCQIVGRFQSVPGFAFFPSQ